MNTTPKPETKSGWSIAYLTQCLEREKAILAECEASSHPFRAAMIQGQHARIASIQRHLNAKPTEATA